MALPENPNIKDIINTLEELEGINQKTELASVIGFPAIPNETIAQQITSLISGKQTIVNALNSKDVTANISESIEDLGQKINNISTVRLFASGVTLSSSETLTFDYYDGGGISRFYVTVSGLDFRPSRILIYRNDNNLPFEEITEFGSIGNIQDVCRLSDYNTTQANVTTYSFDGNFGNAYVNNTGFRLPVYRSGTQYNWEAYE